jgi:dipeptidyl aminopeptidase/acylaminoacyl peptidase
MSAATLGIALLLQAGLPAAGSDLVVSTRRTLENAKTEAARQPRRPLYPREDYLRGGVIGDVRLAPDGRFVSFLQRSEKGVDLILQTVATGARARIVAGLPGAETAWSGDGRRLWLADNAGLAVIEMAGLKPRRILKWDQRRSQRLWLVDPRAPHHVVIHEKVVTSGVERHRYLRVDGQGKTRLLLEAPLPVRNALLDAKGALAFTAAFHGPRYETAIREHSSAGAREILRCSSLEDCRLVGYNAAARAVFVLSQKGDGKLTLQRRQSEGNRWQVVHKDPISISDADAIVWSSARQDWLAIAYHGGRRRWYASDRATRAVLAAVQAKLPGVNLHLSATNDARFWLVQAQQGDRVLDRYYMYDASRDRLQPLFARELAAHRAAPAGSVMHPVAYRASDGMLLHGYVMLPPGLAPQKAPIVAWLHGGPITRIYDRYDPILQMLVNRGYAVFVPNFRASTGYGLKYVLASKGDVGNGRVLADIIEGLDFLLAQGIGDRKRQAVMGMSFGGYASLLALTHHPSRFLFAFAGAPPTEYGWIKEWQAEHDSESLRGEGAPASQQFTRLGFRYRDADWRQKMQRESPLASIRVLKSPAYIWAGARDDRVPLKSIVNYAGEARRLGKPLSLLIDPQGGHTPATRLGSEAALYMIERAAHRHFGGPVTPPSPELTAFMQRNVRIDIGQLSTQRRAP